MKSPRKRRVDLAVLAQAMKCANEVSLHEAERRFGISRKTIRTEIQRLRTNG